MSATTYMPAAAGLEPGTAWSDDHPCAACGWTASAHGDDGTCPEVEDTRTVLVHLNVTVPAGDARTADKIADAILNAIEVGKMDASVAMLEVCCPLAEDIEQ